MTFELTSKYTRSLQYVSVTSSAWLTVSRVDTPREQALGYFECESYRSEFVGEM